MNITPWLKLLSQGLTVTGPRSKVSAEAQALPYPEPSDILTAPTHCGVLSLLTLLPWALSHRHFREVRKRTVRIEGLRNSTPQAKILSLAYKTDSLGFPKGLLCIHRSNPSSVLPSIHTCSIIDNVGSFSAVSSLKKRKKERKKEREERKERITLGRR